MKGKPHQLLERARVQYTHCSRCVTLRKWRQHKHLSSLIPGEQKIVQTDLSTTSSSNILFVCLKKINSRLLRVSAHPSQHMRMVFVNTLTYFTHNKALLLLLRLGTYFACGQHLTLVHWSSLPTTFINCSIWHIFRPFTPNGGKAKAETLNNMQFPVNHFIQLKSTDLQRVGLGRHWAQCEGVKPCQGSCPWGVAMPRESKAYSRDMLGVQRALLNSPIL